MKKLLVVLFVSSISINSIFVNNIEADDVKEFQIEGMSVGDSLLNFYSKEEINKAKKNRNYNLYPENKFAHIAFAKKKNDEYDAIAFAIRPNDNNYEIYSIAGRIAFNNNLEACKKKMSAIYNEVSNIVTNQNNIRKEDGPHFEDTSGKSMTYGFVFYLERGAVDLYCIDWSREFEAEKNYVDQLNLTVHSHEMRTFLTTMYEKRNR